MRLKGRFLFLSITDENDLKYRKQNTQPKRKLVRQIILEINSLDMRTHRNFLFLVVPLLFIIILFSLTNIFSPITTRSESARHFDNYKEKSRVILDWLINKGIITRLPITTSWDQYFILTYFNKVWKNKQYIW
jgi:hypothetical protein